METIGFVTSRASGNIKDFLKPLFLIGATNQEHTRNHAFEVLFALVDVGQFEKDACLKTIEIDFIGSLKSLNAIY